ncbi:hypothetical protein V8B97DRAFT_537929 [Scleroderma yunnanense]
MYMINVNAFVDREQAMKMGKQDCGINVLEFRDDESTDYAILSHRWIGKEVDYKETTKLARMKEHDQKAVRDCDGYKKILASCEKAKRDGYEWLWVDTCCIDKRSNTELSEAINSMYRWYQNSKVCYAYLHDVTSTSLPKRSNDSMYPNSSGWPEWFSRGWTLQEMIASSNVQFFNKDWQPMGDKKTHANTLSKITRVPAHILVDGLPSNRPCVAQIMSWAANRKTTRVEDKAYSLMGLLDVNMPMLYGEGKKAFHRLQLEIIRMSSDQSIFAWGHHGNERPGSILADDPSFFWDCNQMELMDHNEFIQSMNEYYIPEDDLSSISEDQFGVFPITNRGIQIWMLLCPLDDSDSVFHAWLPCRSPPSDLPVRITLALWNSNYYRYFTSEWDKYNRWQTLQFRQIYLRYQDTLHRDVTFEIDDSAIARNGFTCYSFPQQRKTFTSTGTNYLHVQAYADRAGHRIAVGVGQCFGQDWIHVAGEGPTVIHSQVDFIRSEYKNMLARGPQLARSMTKVHCGDGHHDRIWVKHFCLPGSIWIVQTSYIVWKNSRNRGVRINAFRSRYMGPGKWIGVKVEESNDLPRDVRGLMIPYQVGATSSLRVDGVSMEFSRARAPNGIKLGDYGYFTDEVFHRVGNISVTTLKRHHKISDPYGGNTDSDCVKARYRDVELFKPVGISIGINGHVKSWLDRHSVELTNKYLVTMVIQCAAAPSSGDTRSDRSRRSGPTTPFCLFKQPFVWHRNEDSGFASVESSSNDPSESEYEG